MISDLSITGENLSLLNGIKTLSVVSGQDSSVKVQGTISDEPAGFDSLWIELLEKNSGSRVSGSIDSYEVDSSGNFEVVFDFEYLAGGDWILGGFNINDRANNEAYYWTDGQNPGNSSWEKEQIEILKAIGVDINSFEINVGNENTDSTAPVISNVVLNYDQDTSRVVFNGDIKDDLSGFDYLWLRLENQEVSEHFWLDVADWSIDWDENEEFTQRAGSFSLAERRSDLPSGTYVITDAQLSDRAGNSIDLWRWDGESDKNNAISQLKNSGLDIENLSLKIVNPDADSLLPVFTDFSISRTGSIDVESDSIVEISGNVSDADGSGFSSLHIILVDSNGTEKSISLNKDSEELNEAGDFTLDIDFKYSAAGTWRLKEAFLMDEAGNQASFYDGDWDSDDEAAKFLASGIDLEQFTFDIANNNQQDISLPQITELLLRNGSQVELSGIIDDGLLGSGLDEFRINLYNFTIKEWLQLEVAPADLSLETGAFSVMSPYEYLTNAEWRIENIYLSDIAGNNVNYWRSGWDANLQRKRLLGTLLNPEGTQFILDPLIDLTNGETSAGLVGGSNALIELDYNPVFLEEETGDSALDDVEVVNDLADGLEDVLGEEESITSELVSFNADVRGDSGSAVDQIYRFELNLPGDVNKISIKKQFADKSQGFADFKNVFTDSSVGASSSDGQRAEGLTVEDGKLILYIQDQGVFDHNPLEGFITDPFVVTSQAKELESIVKPKPLARPEGVADEQQKNDLETLVEDSVNEEEAADDGTDAGTNDGVNDVTPPTIESAVIDGDRLTITLNESIKSTVPKANNFKVKIGRKKSKVESVTVGQATNTVVLALKMRRW